MHHRNISIIVIIVKLWLLLILLVDNEYSNYIFTKTDETNKKCIMLFCSIWNVLTVEETMQIIIKKEKHTDKEYIIRPFSM